MNWGPADRMRHALASSCALRSRWSPRTAQSGKTGSYTRHSASKSLFIGELGDARLIFLRQAGREALDRLPVRVRLGFVEIRQHPCRDSAACQHDDEASSQPSSYSHTFPPERALAALNCRFHRGHEEMFGRNGPLARLVRLSRCRTGAPMRTGYNCAFRENSHSIVEPTPRFGDLSRSAAFARRAIAKASQSRTQRRAHHATY